MEAEKKNLSLEIKDSLIVTVFTLMLTLVLAFSFGIDTSGLDPSSLQLFDQILRWLGFVYLFQWTVYFNLGFYQTIMKIRNAKNWKSVQMECLTFVILSSQALGLFASPIPTAYKLLLAVVLVSQTTLNLLILAIKRRKM